MGTRSRYGTKKAPTVARARRCALLPIAKPRRKTAAEAGIDPRVLGGRRALAAELAGVVVWRGGLAPFKRTRPVAAAAHAARTEHPGARRRASVGPIYGKPQRERIGL